MRLYVELGVDGPEFLVGGGLDDLEVDLVEDVDQVGQDLLVAEVVVLADLVDLLEVEDLVFAHRVLQEERAEDDVGGGLVQLLHLALLYMERSVEVGKHVVESPLDLAVAVPDLLEVGESVDIVFLV